MKLWNKKGISLTIVAGCLVSGSAQAIVNIESLRMNAEQLGWSSSINFSGQGKKGNTDKDAVKVGFGVQFVEEHSRTFLIGSVEYGENSQKKDDESYFAHLRHTHDLVPTWAWEAFTQYEAEPLVYDKQRSLLGAGLRKSVQAKELKWHFGVGAFYEHETAVLNNANLTTDLGRGNFYTTFKHQLNDHASWFGSAYYQPQLDRWNHYRAIATLGAESKLTQLISLSLGTSYGYESSPLASAKKEDLAYQFGIQVNF